MRGVAVAFLAIVGVALIVLRRPLAVAIDERRLPDGVARGFFLITGALLVALAIVESLWS